MLECVELSSLRSWIGLGHQGTDVVREGKGRRSSRGHGYRGHTTAFREGGGSPCLGGVGLERLRDRLHSIERRARVGTHTRTHTHIYIYATDSERQNASQLFWDVASF